MAELLKGAPVAGAITRRNVQAVEELKSKGITPTLAIVRLGEKPEDLAYEKGALKRAEKTGVTVKQFIFPETMTEKTLIKEIGKINKDDSIHGVLMFRPLPEHIDEKAVCEALAPEKDLDGITSGSMAGVFMDAPIGYPPCTAEAVMELLDHYDVPLKGSKVTIFGRSLVIGKPVAMMLMGRHATITVCHSRTAIDDFRAAGAGADVVVSAMGRAKMIGAEVLGSEQTIIDVGINMDEDGNLCGDVNFEEAEEKAAAITPVPGGVGSVTTAVLMKHVVQAAQRSIPE